MAMHCPVDERCTFKTLYKGLLVKHTTCCPFRLANDRRPRTQAFPFSSGVPVNRVLRVPASSGSAASDSPAPDGPARASPERPISASASPAPGVQSPGLRSSPPDPGLRSPQNTYAEPKAFSLGVELVKVFSKANNGRGLTQKDI